MFLSSYSIVFKHKNSLNCSVELFLCSFEFLAAALRPDGFWPETVLTQPNPEIMQFIV